MLIKDVSLVIFNLVQFEQPYQFGLKSFLSMANRLSADIRLDGRRLRFAHGERTEPGLPGEITHLRNLLVNPIARNALNVAKDIGNRNRRMADRQEVDMIRNAVKRQQFSFALAQDPSNDPCEFRENDDIQ